jgi:hypothetical protein
MKILDKGRKGVARTPGQIRKAPAKTDLLRLTHRS